MIFLLMITILFSIGVYIGIFLVLQDQIKRKAYGNLVVVKDGDESPYIFLELNNEDLDNICKLNRLELNVEHRNLAKKTNSIMKDKFSLLKGENL